MRILLDKINGYIVNFHNVLTSNKILVKKISIVILALFAIKIFLQLATLLWALREPALIANDATVYLSLGHGVTNGLKIYRDIFEIKPPGIFIISAISIFFSQGPTLALILQMLAYLAIPILLLWVSRRNTIDMLLALIFGLSISVFLADRTNGLQPEAYGSFFALLFLIFLYKNKIILSVFPLLAAVWMKEPFLLSIFAAVLILEDNYQDIFKKFFVPLFIAGSLAIFLLIISGTLHDYFFSYLAEIFSGRLHYSREFVSANLSNYVVSQPIWIRGLMFQKIYKEWPWFDFIFPLFVFGSFFLKKAEKRWAILGIFVLGMGLLVFKKIEIMHNLLSLLHFQFPLDDAFFRALVLKYVALLLIFLFSFIFLFIKSRKVFQHTLFLLIAIYVITLSVCIGGTFNWHHFAFASPAYLSLFLLYQKSEERWKTCFAILIALMAFNTPKMPLSKRVDSMTQARQMTQINMQYAASVDKVMDECNLDRYMVWIKELNIAAFTRHSPLEFYYAQLAGFDGYSEGPMLKWREDYLASLHEAPLFVTDDLLSVPPDIQKILEKEFTNVSPPCAKNTEDISMYFRKSNE